ncbi:hypothetical protein CO174_04895 [Candidatus Uhrbacteria bacterium CG_4_9_14_3_um_filter_50_9]|uniref:Uncharacterized protein n=1 Tax=Candidatus Uhrbacteria bacterium CG_4_9_14_3_um_filter_50_9 TaxID=1975035 RepID=A0A2M7XB68_9BACT|nr:MAG: hypothetical protein CO174_04895 [Candidatus Uhrbacteria bacterium CG_4_9_14_3_um_filter_50_9]
MAPAGGTAAAIPSKREQLTRARVASRRAKTSSPRAAQRNREMRGTTPGGSSRELLLNQRDRAAGSRNRSTTDARRSKNKATQLANSVSNSFGSRRGLDPQAPAFGPRPDLQTPEAQAAERRRQDETPESNRPRGTQEVDPTPVDQLRAQLSNLKLQMARTKNQSAKDELEKLKDEQMARLRSAIKKRAKAAFKRGVIWVIDLIAASFDIGTVGVSMIVDILIYTFTFGWLNLELFYGKKFRKGKDPFISPLSWDPIPMPVDPNAVILDGLVIAADIAIVILGFCLFFLGFCLMYDYAAFMQNPLNFALSVISTPGSSCVAAIMIGSF